MSKNTLAHLRAGLQRYVRRLSKSAHLLQLEIGPLVEDKFTVKATWRGGQTQITVTGDESKWRACQMAQRLIQNILQQRNV